MRHVTLLTLDATINLLLGVLLLAFSDGLASLLGVPPAAHGFYPNILGGVLFGIGIALLMERRNKTGIGIGLGLGGAIAINSVRRSGAMRLARLRRFVVAVAWSDFFMVSGCASARNKRRRTRYGFSGKPS